MSTSPSPFSFWHRYRAFGFTRFLIRRMLEFRMMQAAASLTFTTLLALIPLLTVALIVVSAFPVFGDFAERFKGLALGTLVPEYADKVGEYINEFVSNVGNLTAVGVIMLAVTAFMMMRTIEEAFNDIWRTKNSRPVMQQLLVYWMVLTLGPLLIGVGFTLWRWLHHRFGLPEEWPIFAHVFNFLSTLAMTMLVLWLVYRIVPNRHVPARHALIGALFAALLIEAGRYAFGYYVSTIASYQLVYGAFASLPVFLLWLYCLWLVVLAGAIIAASMSYWRGAAWQRPTDVRRHFQDAVEILLLLYQAQHRGKTLRLSHLRESISAGDDQLSFLLDTLEHQKLVHKGQDGWVLQRSAMTLSLSEVMRLFIDEYLPNPQRALEMELHQLLQPAYGVLDITLEMLDRRLKSKKTEEFPPASS